jgi:hypothetical protein
MKFPREATLSLPALGMIAGTRALLGAGVALLVFDKLSGDQRRSIGRTLVLIGLLSTLPLGLEVLNSEHRKEKEVEAA